MPASLAVDDGRGLGESDRSCDTTRGCVIRVHMCHDRRDVLLTQPGQQCLLSLTRIAAYLVGRSDHPRDLGDYALLVRCSLVEGGLQRPDGAPVHPPTEHPVEPTLGAVR